MDNERIIVIGASAGGVEALLSMTPRLSPHMAAPVVIVLHIGSHRSLLPELLSAKGPNPAVFAQSGMVPRPGRIYVAPPDQHVLIQGGELVLVRGPKEHHARPAINPLFRSAALDKGARAIGVVLTGMLDDGAAGLHAIKVCGGSALVQDPQEATEPSMPLSAIASASVDHVLRIDEMTDMLNMLAQPLATVPSDKAPQWLRVEHAVSLGQSGLTELSLVASPSGFTCPDCGGSLFEMREGKPLRFLCHTGHAYSLLTLASLQEGVAEENLWAALRALQEKEALLRRLAESQRIGDSQGGGDALTEAAELAQFIDHMRGLVRKAPDSAAVK